MFSLLQELQLLQYFSIFQNYAEEIDSQLLCSVFNVVKQFFSKYVLSVHSHLSHNLNVFFYETQYGLVNQVLWQLVSY